MILVRPPGHWLLATRYSILSFDNLTFQLVINRIIPGDKCLALVIDCAYI